MSLSAEKSFKMKMRDVETAFKYRRFPYPKRSVELIALLAISCTFFLFMHTNKLNSRLKEMEMKLQPSEFSALGLTGSNHLDAPKHEDINTLHGTYQYLKSTGQLHDLTPAKLNNTPNAEIDLVFFNRVPKVGSQTMMELLLMLGKRNHFKAVRDKPGQSETIMLTENFEVNLVEDIMEVEQPGSYTKHVAYIDFEYIDYPQPIYINLVRDPVERIISWFYYVRAPWYIAERTKLFPKEYKIPSVQWLKKDLSQCVLSHDPECVYAQNDRKGLGDHRRQLLFFCGQDAETCMPFNNYEAMQRAKQNVESKYAVVGSWEDTNVTLSVLEHYIPRFFAGAAEEYYKSENRLQKTNRNNFRPPVSDEQNSAEEVAENDNEPHHPKSHHNGRRNHQRHRHQKFRKIEPVLPVHEKDNRNHKQNRNPNGSPHVINKIHKIRDNHILLKPQNDYEDTDSTEEESEHEQLDGENSNEEYKEELADALNNTKRAEIDVVFFNRVPKVGSQSLMELMGRLGKINGYVHTRDKGKPHETIFLKAPKQKELIEEVYAQSIPRAYSQHIAYINFTQHHKPRPIYINLVRDPIERIRSWHYYVRAEWYYRDLLAKLGPTAPKMPPKEFMEMDLDTCVLKGDIHCQFTPMEITNKVGDHRRQTLFFCGQNQMLCMPFNSKAAMQKAKRTVEEDYAVVGTWEETDITLTVLEHYIPKFFTGAKKVYYEGKDHLSSINKNNVSRPINEVTRILLRRNLTHEIEFYEFCKQRLYLQYSAITEDLSETGEYAPILDSNEHEDDYEEL